MYGLVEPTLRCLQLVVEDDAVDNDGLVRPRVTENVTVVRDLLVGRRCGPLERVAHVVVLSGGARDALRKVRKVVPVEKDPVRLAALELPDLDDLPEPDAVAEELLDLSGLLGGGAKVVLCELIPLERVEVETAGAETLGHRLVVVRRGRVLALRELQEDVDVLRGAHGAYADDIRRLVLEQHTVVEVVAGDDVGHLVDVAVVIPAKAGDAAELDGHVHQALRLAERHKLAELALGDVVEDLVDATLAGRNIRLLERGDDFGLSVVHQLLRGDRGRGRGRGRGCAVSHD
jgi:hypothetical protein